jgi:hypothetical protein
VRAKDAEKPVQLISPCWKRQATEGCTQTRFERECEQSRFRFEILRRADRPAQNFKAYRQFLVDVVDVGAISAYSSRRSKPPAPCASQTVPTITISSR